MEIFKKNIFLYTILLFLIVFYLQSCRILKKNVEQDSKASVTLYDSINKYNLHYTSISYRASVKFVSEKNNYTFYSNINIIKDSAISINSYLPLGIKLAQMLFFRDSNLLYFNINNTYLKGNNTFFLNKFDLALNYYSLQSLLTDEYFKYPYFYENNPSVVLSDTLLYLNTTILNKRNPKVVDINSSFCYSKLLRLKKLEINDYVLKRKLVVNYSDFKLISDSFFPSKINIEIQSYSDTSFIYIKIKNIKLYSNSSFNINMPTNAKIIY